MTYNQIKTVVEILDNPETDLKQIITLLLDDGIITMADIYSVAGEHQTRSTVINGVSICAEKMATYMALNKGGNTIQCIKMIREDYKLGLAESKYINDEIKTRITFEV